MDTGTQQSQQVDDWLLLQLLQQLSLADNTATVQAQQSQPELEQQQEQQGVVNETRIIWEGILEWHEKQKGPPEAQKIIRQVPCQVTFIVVEGEAAVKGDLWPQRLIMQLIPKVIVERLGTDYLRDGKADAFMFQPCEALQSLTTAMDNEFAGCVHFTGTDYRQEPQLHHPSPHSTLQQGELDKYLGVIPNDQPGFVDRIRTFIQQLRSQQASMTQGRGPNFPMGNPGPCPF